MIGADSISLAAEYGFKVSNGVAYGNMCGYAAALSDVSEGKMLVISTAFPREEEKRLLEDELTESNLREAYCVSNISFLDSRIEITFSTESGTMGGIKEFADFFFPLLDKYGATGINVCPLCGREFADNGSWKLVDGIALHLHDGCAENMRRTALAESQGEPGTLGKGILGAMTGSVISAIPWAIVGYMGYFASIFGLVTGLLTKKFYELFHGRKGKGKVAVIVICALIGVAIGCFGADAIELAVGINKGYYSGITAGQIPAFILWSLIYIPEYRSEAIRYLCYGIGFAIIGMFDVLRGIKQEAKGADIIDLD